MSWFDITIICIIVFSSLISVIRGFTKEAISLVTWFSAFFVASKFHPEVAQHLTQLEDHLVRTSVAIAILFIAVLLLGALVNYIINRLVSVTGLSGTDRLLGMIFGAIRGVLVVSALLFFIDQFTSFHQEKWWIESTLVHEFEFVIAWFFQHIENSSSFLNEIQI
jgi:membrane protein required for colicin V production